MTLFSFAIRNLWRRPTRSMLSIIGIALAVGAAIALLALSAGIQRSVEEGFDERGSQLAVLRRGATSVFGDLLPESLLKPIAQTPGVGAASPELAVFSTTAQQRSVVVLGWPIDSFVWANMPIKSGRKPAAGEVRSVVLGDALAESLGLKSGETFEIFEEVFQITGIAGYRSVMNRSLVIMPLAELQELTFRPGQVTGFTVRMDGHSSITKLEELKARLETVGPVMVSETRDMLSSDRNVKILNGISLAISIVAMGIGLLGVLNTMLISVQERTREIGIIAALGWPRLYVVGLILIEGAVLGAFGSFAGLSIGMAATRLFSFLPAIGDYITFTPSVPQLAAVSFLALAFSIVGALYPALRAVSIDPGKALRRL